MLDSETFYIKIFLQMHVSVAVAFLLFIKLWSIVPLKWTEILPLQS